MSQKKSSNPTNESKGQQFLSSHWREVATMRPKLRTQAEIHRHVLRNRVWYVLQDHVTGRFHRLSPELYYIVALMDGNRTVQDIWLASCSHQGENCPTQDEVIQLLGRLHSADVLRGGIAPDLREIAQRSRFQRRRKALMQFRSPLAIRVPLFDPDRFLDATKFLVRPFFSTFGLILWIAVLLWGISLGVTNWVSFTADVTDRVLSADNLVLLWMVFPLVKIAHELGHGYAAKIWGGEVHEMGIMFLVFIPVPYVEASSATAFPSRWQRMLVGAGGMFAEIPLAVGALWFWTQFEPGLARSAMYNVVLVAGVSTVLFNGNPLLRFDGYYILMDWLEMPNLGPRANRYIGYLFQRKIFGVSHNLSPADAPNERGVLFFYAIASYLYRLTVMTAIILFVATKFFTVGLVLAAWAGFQMFVMPIVKIISFLVSSAILKGKRTRALGISGILVATVSSFLLLVPAPLATVAEGVIWAPENSTLRVDVGGFVVDLFVRSGQSVSVGDRILELEDPLQHAELRVLQAQQSELQAQLLGLSEDPSSSKIVQTELNLIGARVDQARSRLESQVITAPIDGVFLSTTLIDLPGRHVNRGEGIGFVTDMGDPVIQVAIPASEIDLMSSRLSGIEVRRATNISNMEMADLILIEPSATRRLKNPALAIQGGGPFSTDPSDPSGLTLLTDVFHIEITVPKIWKINRIGDRVLVRFDLGYEPLGLQIYRKMRHLMLKRFDV